MNSTKSSVPDLKNLREQCLGLLARGAADKKDPLHTLCLITGGKSGTDGRMVIFRKWLTSPYALELHTDVRSAKWADLSARPEHAWLGWHHRKQIQIRIQAIARLHAADELAAERWKNVPLPARFNYGAPLPPGTPVQSPELAAHAAEGDFANFGVILAEVRSMDMLWLRQEGHIRARFDREGEIWRETWLTP